MEPVAALLAIIGLLHHLSTGTIHGRVTLGGTELPAPNVSVTCADLDRRTSRATRVLRNPAAWLSKLASVAVAVTIGEGQTVEVDLPIAVVPE